jgi:integrase
MNSRQRARRGSDQIQRRVDRFGIVTFYARYTERGVRRFAVLKATDEEGAKTELMEMKVRIRKGEPAIPTEIQRQAKAGGLTVAELARRFCGVDDEFKTGAGAEHRNPTKYRRQFWSVLKCHVLDHIGKLDAMEVKPRDIKSMKKALLDGKQHNRTVQRALNHTSRLFNWAIIDEELIERDNPCTGIKKPKTTGNTEFYTEDEVARMLAKAAEKMPALYPIVATAFYCGLRKGELASLRWSDVDLEGGRIAVTRSWTAPVRKSGAALVVHVHPHLDAILRAHRPEEPSSDALVFPDDTGKMRDEFDTWGLRELAELAKVRRFRYPWHSLRHSNATALAASGASLTEIRDALGQSTLQMAANYSHLAAEHVKKRVMALPRLGPAPS